MELSPRAAETDRALRTWCVSIKRRGQATPDPEIQLECTHSFDAAQYGIELGGAHCRVVVRRLVELSYFNGFLRYPHPLHEMATQSARTGWEAAKRAEAERVPQDQRPANCCAVIENYAWVKAMHPGGGW